MNFLRKIAFPFVPVYYFVIWVRNIFYDLGVFNSVAFDFPVIAVGNLSVGGTGKSPMVEYLISFLSKKKQVATLSRGYKRKTKGFYLVSTNSTVAEVGDEPLQIKLKFPSAHVSVDANRVRGIEKLRSIHSSRPEVIILDDAYQHRSVKAAAYILLTSFNDLYCDDMMLPTGNLREPRYQARRANFIVVTKCPVDISDKKQEEIRHKLQLNQSQMLFFSSIVYKPFINNLNNKKSIDSFKNVKFTLVTGIANPKSLLHYYSSIGLDYEHIAFPDHHNFTLKEIEQLRSLGLIITTEKDFMRLKSHIPTENLWYQPIEIKIISNQEKFENIVWEQINKF